ncbi:hypothetical protein [Pseudocitrobacter faecalis]|uniref:hypothetical protein n=1 Tax=Pseudocitrobacter faecalis TaxID=1398493 RepID=UPI003B9ECBA8
MLRNDSMGDYLGDILSGRQQINSLNPDHAFLQSLPLLEEMMENNTQYFLLLTIDEAQGIVDDLIGYTDDFMSYRMGAGNIKDVWDGLRNTTLLMTWRDANKICFNLRALFIKATPYRVNGVEYIKISGYPGLRRILNGTRYRANNLQMLELGIGRRGIQSTIIKGARFCIYFSLAWRGVELMLKSEYNLIDFLGDITMDAAKLIVSSLVTFAVWSILSALSASIILTSSSVILLNILMNAGLNRLDNTIGTSVKLKEIIRDAFREQNQTHNWHREHLDFENYYLYQVRN